MPVPDTEEIRRRREQSDRASREIGIRLLQGWAMLANECPGPACYGVPLVRPPKAGSDKDPRKVRLAQYNWLSMSYHEQECVICGTSYISEVDPRGHQRLTPFNAVNQNSDASLVETAPGSNIQVHHSFMFLTVYRSLYTLDCPNGTRRHLTYQTRCYCAI